MNWVLHAAAVIKSKETVRPILIVSWAQQALLDRPIMNRIISYYGVSHWLMLNWDWNKTTIYTKPVYWFLIIDKIWHNQVKKQSI